MRAREKELEKKLKDLQVGRRKGRWVYSYMCVCVCVCNMGGGYVRIIKYYMILYALTAACTPTRPLVAF